MYSRVDPFFFISNTSGLCLKKKNNSGCMVLYGRRNDCSTAERMRRAVSSLRPPVFFHKKPLTNLFVTIFGSSLRALAALALSGLYCYLLTPATPPFVLHRRVTVHISPTTPCFGLWPARRWLARRRSSAGLHKRRERRSLAGSGS